jgi:hypothetical protein
MSERKIPDWLKNLQENSWELELLISGGAIFSLFQVSDLFLDSVDVLRVMAMMPGTSIIMMVGMIAIKTLTLGFIIHLVLRAYWLALVCINYVYPTGVRKEKIKWKKPFKIKTENHSDLELHITRVDKQCGTVIFMSIISVFSIVGFCLIFVSLMAVMSFIENESANNIFEIVFSVIMLFIPIYILDFLTFGLLRRIPWFSYLIFPVFKLYDIISFRRFYQQPLWLFNTNVKRIKFFISALVFAAFSITFAYLSVYKVMHWPNMFDQREYRWQMSNNAYMSYSAYMDEWPDEKSYRIGINSKIQSSGFLELYVGYRREYDFLIDQTSNIDSLKSFDKILSVMIDTNRQNSLTWHPSSKPNNRIGITTFIPLDSLKKGLHVLTVWTEIQYPNKDMEYEMGEYAVTIPFIVDR